MPNGEARLEAQVLTPEGEVFKGDLFQLSTRTTVGEVGIRGRHAPLMARLAPGLLRLHVKEGETIRYAQGEGWLEVFGNRAQVLIVEAIPPDQLEVGELRQRLADAERRLKETEGEADSTAHLVTYRREGTAAHEQAVRDKARAEAFIEIAEGE